MLYAGFGKPFSPFGKGAIPFAKPLGKGFGKPFGAGGYPATYGSGFTSAIPVTSVATTPFPGI